MSQTVKACDGFFFGLGAFETIAVVSGRPILESYHLERLEQGLGKLGIPCRTREELHQAVVQGIEAYRRENPQYREKFALKLAADGENLLVTARPILYGDADYARGFSLRYSPIIRNETSPLTGVKSLACADNILEKRRAHRENFDEPIFLNSRGLVTEGAVSNLFGVLDGQLVTPAESCGLLPGTVRRFLLEHLPVRQMELTPDDLLRCTELFVTNALMGIMPVAKLEQHTFQSRKITEQVAEIYRHQVLKQN